MAFDPVRLPPGARLPILGTRVADIAPDVLVVGDPDRARAVSALLTDVRAVSAVREYVVFTGTHEGRPVTVASHGVGAAGASIAFTELCRAGAARIIRVGTAGGMQPEVVAGDVVVATAAVRDEGSSERLVPAAFPAVADPELTASLWSRVRRAADPGSGPADASATGEGVGSRRGAAATPRTHRGIVLTSDLFYPGPMLGSGLAAWQNVGVVATEMELSALFVIASLHRVRAAGVLAIDGNPLASQDEQMAGYRPRGPLVAAAVERSAAAALVALGS